jgi:alpha-L-fucosidase
MSDSDINAAQAQHAILGLDTQNIKSQHTTHPEAQWFPDASLGLFIHWGIASVHGNLDLSWAMVANTTWDSRAGGINKLTPEQYWKLAERFKPDRYDPNKWLSAAAAAGFKYAVLTVMHHDGFTLWPSEHSDFGVRQYLPGRDIVGEYIEACRKNGLKAGLYYSPPDWRFDRQYMSFNYQNFGPTPAAQNSSNGFPTLDQRHQAAPIPPKPAGHDERRRELFHKRVKELMTRYGRIDILWFDGGAHDNEVRDMARKTQPHLVMNSRSCDGDFDCTECELPTQRPTGWFETCHCWQACDIVRPNGQMLDVWGYLATEKYKSSAWMLQTLGFLRGWGANLLLNVGPRPTGELPDVVYERFDEVRGWMLHSRDSVIGAAPCPPEVSSNVPLTVNKGKWHLHAGPELAGAIEVRPIARPKAVSLLRTGSPLAFEWHDRKLTLTIPAAMRTPLVDVATVEFTDPAR